MDEMISLVFLFILLIAGGLVLNIEVANLDTSSWTFTGASFLISLVNYFPLVYGSITTLILALGIWEVKK